MWRDSSRPELPLKITTDLFSAADASKKGWEPVEVDMHVRVLPRQRCGGADGILNGDEVAGGSGVNGSGGNSGGGNDGNGGNGGGEVERVGTVLPTLVGVPRLSGGWCSPAEAIIAAVG